MAMTITAIEVIEFLCLRCGILCPYAESTDDVLAAIRGICMGVGDLEGNTCLGDFPAYVQQVVPIEDRRTWFDALRRLCAGKPKSDVLIGIGGLIDCWKNSNPVLPESVLLPEKTALLDAETFDLIEDAYRRPEYFVPQASTLGEMTTFVCCYLNTRWPPHGGAIGTEELHKHFCDCLGEPWIYRTEIVLQRGLAHLQFLEACRWVADNIRIWRTRYQPN
jgi:hypothetical protein